MRLADLTVKLRALDNDESLCENDTIEHFIVPVLRLAHWPVDSVNPLCLKRGNRATRGRRSFDLELWRADSMSPSFVFECKKLSCSISLMGRGALSNTARLHSDYARQLRRDCDKNDFSCDPLSTIPVLTNGREWVIFKPAFIYQERLNENIDRDNYDDFVKVECSINEPRFAETVIPELDFNNVR